MIGATLTGEERCCCCPVCSFAFLKTQAPIVTSLRFTATARQHKGAVPNRSKLSPYTPPAAPRTPRTPRPPGASALLPLADDGGQLEVRQRARRRTARRAAALGGVLINNIRRGPPPLQPPPRPAQPSQPPPPYAGSCPAAARPLLEATAARLERGGGAAVAAAGSGSKSSSASSSGGDGSAGGGGSYFTAQRGAVTWGLTDAGDDGACNDAVSGCAANNPSAPYGLVVLPLAPEEVGGRPRLFAAMTGPTDGSRSRPVVRRCAEQACFPRAGRNWSPRAAKNVRSLDPGQSVDPGHCTQPCGHSTPPSAHPPTRARPAPRPASSK